MSKGTKTIIISAAVITAIAVASGTALAQPPEPIVPADYQGTVYVAGVPAGPGLNVTASILGWTSEEGDITDASGKYWLGGISPTGFEEECLYTSCSGEVIHFYINGTEAHETATFTAGESVTNFDLHVDALPTATPTYGNVSTPTPTPTSTEGTAVPTEPTATLTTPAASTTPRATPTSTPTPTPGEGGISWGAIAGIAAFALLLLSGLIAMLVSNRMGGRKRARRRKKSPPPQQ